MIKYSQFLKLLLLFLHSLGTELALLPAPRGRLSPLPPTFVCMGVEAIKEGLRFKFNTWGFEGALEKEKKDKTADRKVSLVLCMLI